MKSFTLVFLLIAVLSYLFNDSQGFLLDPQLKQSLQLRNLPKNNVLVRSYDTKLLNNAVINGASLDNKLIPSTFVNSYTGQSGLVVTVAAVLIVAMIRLSWTQLAEFFSNAIYEITKATKNVFSFKNKLLEKKVIQSPLSQQQTGRAVIRQPIRQPIRQSLGNVNPRAVNSASFSPSATLVKDYKQEVSSSAPSTGSWNTCRFEGKETLNPKYTSYKFRVAPDYASTLSEVGKKLIIATTNKDGNAVKGSFYPISSIYSKSTFEVVVGSNQVEDSEELIDSLNQLQLDDQVAIKLDRSSSLKYRGSDDAIQNLTVVASGWGIVPVLQLLRRILKGDLFQIDSCELLWINSSKEDFIYNAEVEKLESEHGSKFSVARVLDVNVESENTMLNPRLIESLPLYESGRVSLIAGDEILKNKFVTAFSERLGYSNENIVTLSM